LSLFHMALALLLSMVHAFIPGIFRYSNGGLFIGSNTTESVIVIIHIVCSPFFVFLLLWMLFANIIYFSRQSNALKRLIAFTDHSTSAAAKLNFWMDLDGIKNIIAWTNLWEIQFLRYKNHPWKRRFGWTLAPILLLTIVLLLALFIRFVVLKAAFEMFLVLFLYDVVVLSLFLLILIRFVISCNTLSQRTQVEVLEGTLYGIVVSDPAAAFQNTEKAHVCRLLQTYITKVKNVPDTVELLGVVVDEQLFYQFLALLATGATAAVTRILGIE